MRFTSFRPAAAVLAVALLASGCVAAGDHADHPGGAVIRQDGNPQGLRGSVWSGPQAPALPAEEFTATDGSSFDLSRDATSPVTLVFFGYTNCPDVCGIVVGNVATALRDLDDAARDKIRFVFVTTDPDRDSPDVLRAYLDRYGADPPFEGLTGDVEGIERAAKVLGVFIDSPSARPDGGYEVPHTDVVIGFGPDKVAKVVWSPDTAVGDLSHDLGVLVAQT